MLHSNDRKNRRVQYEAKQGKIYFWIHLKYNAFHGRMSIFKKTKQTISSIKGLHTKQWHLHSVVSLTMIEVSHSD